MLVQCGVFVSKILTSSIVQQFNKCIEKADQNGRCRSSLSFVGLVVLKKTGVFLPTATGPRGRWLFFNDRRDRAPPALRWFTRQSTMIKLSTEQRAIGDGVAAICKHFDDNYWMSCERESRFPFEFHKAMATAGWLS